LEFGRKKKKYNLIFEFIAGDNLKDVYEKKEKKEKLSIVYEICSILDQFHLKKLIHRDIKPGNIMVQSENNNKVKLIDFGISKIATHTATYTKQQIGTLPYMPPEMFDFDPELFSTDDKDARPVPVSAKSDIWSLGCLISEVFSGIKPWSTKKEQKMTETTITSKLQKKTKFPIPSNVDPDVKALIESATRVDPEDRPSAFELKGMIEKIMSSDK